MTEQQLNYDQTGRTEANETDVVFSRATSAGLPANTVQQIADAIKGRWANAPEIIVVQNMDDARIPASVRSEDARQRQGGAQGSPRGFFLGGKVYLVADSIASTGDAVTTLFHEALGHAGLRGVFGKELGAILDQLATLRRGEIIAKAREYGLVRNGADGKPVVDVKTATNAEMLAAMDQSHKRTAAEEVLAEMAQTRPEIGYVKRAIAAIRAFLRKNVPGFAAMKLTDNDIVQQYILPARAWVERGGVGVRAGGALAFNRDGVTESQPTDQTQTEAFKRWYSGNDGQANQRVIAGRASGELADSAVRPQRNGPLDDQNRPVVFYHGTRDDIAAFDTSHVNRKDKGWLGRGVYGISDPDLAGDYAGMKRGSGSQNVMPLYFAVTNPYKADLSIKRRLRNASQETIDAFTEKVKASGHDGVMLTLEDGVIEIVAFEPTQVKSVTGNNGDFDPDNADIRFSRTSPAGATGSMSDRAQEGFFNVKNATGGTLAHYRGMSLQALGRRQIVDLFKEYLPQLSQYNDLVQNIEAEKNDNGAEADKVARSWGDLDKTTKKPGEEQRLAELMHDATLAQMDPKKDYQPGDNRMQWAGLRARFNALDPQAQALYIEARDMYAGHYDQVQQAVKDRIERSDMNASQKQAMIARMASDFFKKTKGVYFPLARFGKYVMVVKDASGNVVNVSRAETLNEAKTTRQELLRNFDSAQGFAVGKVLKDAEFNPGRDAVGTGFMADLFSMLDKQGVDDALRDSVSQLYLASLPDLSWAKHGIHRKGTPGFSQDARRSFAQNMFHGARYLAKLRYSDRLQNELKGMQDHIKDYELIEEYDSVKAQQVVDEMVKRHEILMNPKTNPLSTALTSVGFVFFLGVSPAAAMVNLSQTALVAYPFMGAKWGFGKASAALLKASKQTVQAKNDISQVLQGDELEAYNQAVKDGTIDVTMAHDLAGVAQGEDAKVMWAMQPVMRWASFLFHHAERFNRQATFVASFRLAKEAGADNKTAFEEAKKATYDGHFDYGAANRPRVMQGNVAKVVLLFKQYGQNMVYTLSRQAYLAMKGQTPAERKEARKVLGGILAGHAMAAGALGLPLVGPLLAAASFLGSDDDEPWDAETALKNAMADSMSPKAAEVLSHGLSRLTPWDISSRVALNRLILPDVREGLEGQKWAESMMVAALGPVGSIFTGTVKGLQEMSEGQHQRGLESMLPVALRNIVKSIRFSEEGSIDKSGVVIKDEVSASGIIGQAAGFAPSEVRSATEGRSAIFQYDRARMDRRKVLTAQFAQARMAGDEEGVADARAAIARFNEKNPGMRITPAGLLQSVRSRQRRIKEAEQGIYLPRNRRDALEAGRFATAEQ